MRTCLKTKLPASSDVKSLFAAVSTGVAAGVAFPVMTKDLSDLEGLKEGTLVVVVVLEDWGLDG